jgi:hypothetical protein
MNAFSKPILLSAVLALSTVGQIAQAQMHDAGAKARGDYSFLPGASAQSAAATAPVYRAPAVASTARVATPAPPRSYSYAAAKAAPNCGATTSDMPGMSRQPARETRTFSYAPAEPVQRRAASVAPFGHSGGVRNAAAKALGQY